MSSDRIAISLEQIGKCYRLFAAPHERLLDAFFPSRRESRPQFWALRGVTTQVRRGETVGILGRNGSGKSTLLQIVAGTLAPSTGAVRVEGRVSAILELGAGFNPEFTGRENVIVNAALAGMGSRELSRRMQAIIDFADIGEFIDQPVKSYSSGMYARLAFAVAINVDPEVLIVDEALSVGDIGFQARCFRKFEEFKSKGVTILFVTHSVDQVARHCSSALLLDHGQLIASGDPRGVIARYLEVVFGTSAASGADDAQEPPGSAVQEFERAFTLSGGDARADRFPARPGYNPLEHRWGNGAARLVDYALLDAGGAEVGAIDTGSRVTLYLKAVFLLDVERPIFGLSFKTADGVEIAGANSRDSAPHREFQPCRRGEEVTVKFSFRCALNAGQYLISVGIAQDEGDGVVPLDRRYDSIVITVVSPMKIFGLANLDIEPAVLDRRELVQQAPTS
jgi:lipopolysaccharide transport system ATP-binding protein